MKNAKHLIKKGNTFYFKRKLPLSKKCITISLQSDSLIKAKFILDILNAKITKLFYMFKQRREESLNTDELQSYIKTLLKKYVLEAIIEYEELEDLRHEDFTYTHVNGIELDGGHPDSIDKALQDLENSIFNKQLKDNLYNRILPRTNITKDELEKIPTNKITMFKNKLIKAEREILQYDKARNQEILEVPNLLKEEFEEFRAIDVNKSFDDEYSEFQEKLHNKVQLSNNQYYSKTLKELKAEYLEKRVEEGLRDPKRYDTDIQMLFDIIGKEYVVDMTQNDMKEFSKILKHLPNKNENQELYNTLTYREIYQKYDELKWEKLSVTTVNNRILRISAFLDWCIEDEYLDHNRLKNKKTKILNKRKSRKWERVGYTTEDLEKFITSKWYTTDLALNLKKHPDKVFAPLISLYQGFRINEICSLYIKDIVTIKGMPCFRIIDDEPDKHIKADTSLREVSKLIAS